MGNRHVPVIIMVEITGGTTKIAVPVMCLQSENNIILVVQYMCTIVIIILFLLKTIIDIKTNTLLAILVSYTCMAYMYINKRSPTHKSILIITELQTRLQKMTTHKNMPVKILLLCCLLAFTRINIGHRFNLSSGLSINSTHIHTYLQKTTTLICQDNGSV